MKVVVLDDQGKRREQIRESLKKGHHEVIDCYTTNDFFSALDKKVDMVALDMETYDKGSSIYSYFGVPGKLERTPILFYNAEEGFSAIDERPRNDKDQILYKPSEVETIVETALQNL